MECLVVDTGVHLMLLLGCVHLSDESHLQSKMGMPEKHCNWFIEPECLAGPFFVDVGGCDVEAATLTPGTTY